MLDENIWKKTVQKCSEGVKKQGKLCSALEKQTNLKNHMVASNVIGYKADSFRSSSTSSRCVWENQCKIYIVRTMGFFILVSSAV